MVNKILMIGAGVLFRTILIIVIIKIIRSFKKKKVIKKTTEKHHLNQHERTRKYEDLSDIQKKAIKKNLLLLTIIGATIFPGIFLLWARAYRIRLIIIVSSIIYYPIGIIVGILIRIIILLKGNELAYDNSKGYLDNLLKSKEKKLRYALFSFYYKNPLRKDS